MKRLTLIGSLSLVVMAEAGARPLPPPPDPAASAPARTLQEARRREPGPADLKEAIEIALERFGGKAAEAATVERDGRRVHEIRLLLDDGSVRTVRIDPATGAIIEPREQR